MVTSPQCLASYHSVKYTPPLSFWTLSHGKIYSPVPFSLSSCRAQANIDGIDIENRLEIILVPLQLAEQLSETTLTVYIAFCMVRRVSLIVLLCDVLQC